MAAPPSGAAEHAGREGAPPSGPCPYAADVGEEATVDAVAAEEATVEGVARRSRARSSSIGAPPPPRWPWGVATRSPRRGRGQGATIHHRRPHAPIKSRAKKGRQRLGASQRHTPRRCRGWGIGEGTSGEDTTNR
ncbi:unnamed protein product [Miscanthus lutarioriparius]|uniref:Uncharacterized protein n=1 Tax=Miscanthus lutarioriparius TaxID=422564 RepID=A0A811N4Y0_9POAL|nr:unnamed protein product [Miscanthus lutarioriparius]